MKKSIEHQPSPQNLGIETESSSDFEPKKENRSRNSDTRLSPEGEFLPFKTVADKLWYFSLYGDEHQQSLANSIYETYSELISNREYKKLHDKERVIKLYAEITVFWFLLFLLTTHQYSAIPVPNPQTMDFLLYLSAETEYLRLLICPGIFSVAEVAGMATGALVVIINSLDKDLSSARPIELRRQSELKEKMQIWVEELMSGIKPEISQKQILSGIKAFYKKRTEFLQTQAAEEYRKKIIDEGKGKK